MTIHNKMDVETQLNGRVWSRYHIKLWNTFQSIKNVIVFAVFIHLGSEKDSGVTGTDKERYNWDTYALFFI